MHTLIALPNCADMHCTRALALALSALLHRISDDELLTLLLLTGASLCKRRWPPAMLAPILSYLLTLSCARPSQMVRA